MAGPGGAVEFGEGLQDPAVGGELLFADAVGVDFADVAALIHLGGPEGEHVGEVARGAAGGAGEEDPGEEGAALGVSGPFLVFLGALVDVARVILGLLETGVVAVEAGPEVAGGEEGAEGGGVGSHGVMAFWNGVIPN